MVFEQLAQAVLSFVNWGITIVVVMLIWEIIQFIRGGTEDRGTGSSGIGKKSLGEIKDSFNEWTGRADVEKKKKITREASREETALLNEYVEEKDELQKIDEAVNEAQACLKVVDSSLAVKSKVPVNSVKDSFDTLSKKVDKAVKETNRLKRNTWRERRRMKQLYEALEEININEKELQNLKVMENYILVKHNEVIQNLAAAAGAVKRAQTLAVPLAKAGAAPNVLTSLEKSLSENIIPPLNKAKEKQQAAYDDTTKMIARIRKVWK